jgi:membrane-associated phospholipid phosphatase
MSMPPNSKPLRLAALAVMFAVLASVALLLDMPLLKFVRSGGLPGDLRKLLDLSEIFGHGLGIALICLTICVLDRARRRCLPRLLACAIGAGLLADLVKLTIARTRPRVFDLPTVWESFRGAFPSLTIDWHTMWDSNLQSFPSGHTAAAVGLAIGMSYLYPHGRWLFTFFAVLAAMQRISSSAHFLSDTLGGAAVGCLASLLCLSPRLLGGWFDRIERRG